MLSLALSLGAMPSAALANGTPAELYASTDPLVHQFMHAEADGPVAFHFPAADYAQGLLERVR